MCSYGFVEDGETVVVVGCGLWRWGCGGRVVDLWVWFKGKEKKRVQREKKKKMRNEFFKKKKMKGGEREMNKKMNSF